MRTATDHHSKVHNGLDSVVSVRDLQVEFPTALGTVRALNGVSFDVPRGKVLGIVGESGCGKSVTARAIMRIIERPGRITGGEIWFQPGERARGDSVTAELTTVDRVTPDSSTVDLVTVDPQGERIRDIRGRQISMIFQEPMTSLNPVYTVGSQIVEAIALHQDFAGQPKKAARKEAWTRAVEMLRKVGMPNPARVAKSYPHQLSGGMRQRAMIAMALSCNPTLLIADEPTTALDVTTEAQILELMRGLQSEIGTSIMFITHSMGVVAQLCDEIAVMYLGKVVERASVDDLFYQPRHPYTVSLLRAIPRIGRGRHEPLEVIKGGLPDPYVTLPGCPFHPRCPSAMTGLCDVVPPLEADVAAEPAEAAHTVRCHLYPGSTPADVATRPAPEPIADADSDEPEEVTP